MDSPRSCASTPGGRLLAAGAFFALALAAGRGAGDDAPSWLDVDRSSLVVVVGLASDVPPEQTAERDRLLEPLRAELERLRAEHDLSLGARAGEPDPAFQELAASESDRALDYLDAMWRSYFRFRAARAAKDPEWMGKQMTAARKYAGRAAGALRRSAEAADERARELGSNPLAVRRAPEAAQNFHDALRRDGLSADHRKLLLESGMTAEDVAAYEAELRATPPGDTGVSVAEYYGLIADHRRTIAAGLERYAAVGVYHDPQANPHTVVNPRDREATIDLHIRPASVPAGWTLSVVDPAAKPTDPKAPAPRSRVEEVVAGKLYRVRLPAKGELQLASVATPGGEVRETTTVRWAVEARIDNKLVGGTVHELRVPAYLPDLELPPVRGAGPSDSGPAAPGTPAADSPAPPGTGFDWRRGALLAAGAAAALAAVAFALRRRVARP